MPHIKQLSPHEAQKIAAGEVIERPVNILKELIENAIDAESTHIKIAIKDGGKELIRVIDNGSGMDEVDARLCFNKHATSKIQTVEELISVETFGFRGEALASIAAVAKVTLFTKRKDSAVGTKVMVEQNVVTLQEAVACNVGTDFSIADLFYTIPTRKKFLKKKETEWRLIVQLFQAFCLDYPTIHFQLNSEDKIIYNCPPAHTLIDRVTQLWDHTIGAHMIPLKSDNSKYGISIQGVTSNHMYHKYDRNGIFFFINNRWVKNFTLSSALLKGYHNVLPPGKYPISALLITIPLDEVDINIHPRKEEVKFMHPRVLEQTIETAVKEALEQNLSKHINIPVQFAPFNTSYQTTSLHTQKPMHHSYLDQPIIADSAQNKSEIDPAPAPFFNTSFFASSKNSGMPLKELDNQNYIKEQQSVLKTVEKRHIIIGQFDKTYILIEKENGLFFIDQHAAHERILYETFKQRTNHTASNTLLFPHLINLSMTEKERITPYLPLFAANNIIMESFGQTQLRVVATPVTLKAVSIEELVKQVIGWTSELSHLEHDDLVLKVDEKMHIQMACKAAIKAGDILTIPEMQKLITNLDTTPSNFCCPHGRPTGWLLSITDIEKKFRRDYK